MHYVLIIGVQNMWKILISNITHFFAHKPLNSEFFIFRSVKLILAPATRANHANRANRANRTYRCACLPQNRACLAPAHASDSRSRARARARGRQIIMWGGIFFFDLNLAKAKHQQLDCACHHVPNYLGSGAPQHA